MVEGGRAELANDLANALMNKGNALQGLGQLPAAVTVYDEAIAILRKLVEGGLRRAGQRPGQRPDEQGSGPGTWASSPPR